MTREHLVKQGTERKAYVVSVGILNESQSIESNLVDELDALIFRRVVDAPLQDTATMAVSGYLHAISGDSVINKLVIEYVRRASVTPRKHSEDALDCPPVQACSGTSG